MEDQIQKYVCEHFEKDVIPMLIKFVQIKNVSPDYDPTWETDGLALEACNLITNFIQEQKLKGCKVEVIKDPGKTHFILATIDGSKGMTETVLMYAHFDKQPPLFEQWRPGLDPYKPVIEKGKLYGRGSVDDGYGSFGAILTIKALQELNIPHPKIIMTFESDEESGDDAEYYIAKLAGNKIPTVDMVVCLDSGCLDYNRLWITSSLRGVVNVPMTVKILDEACHSGDAGGIVPESFRICRDLISKLEDAKTGKMIDSLHVSVPEREMASIKQTATILGKHYYDHFKFIKGAGPLPKAGVEPGAADIENMILNRTWNPTLAVTGADNLPAIKTAGNVLRASTSLKLSIRLPPTLPGATASAVVKEKLTTAIPYGAQVTLGKVEPSQGWALKEYPKEFLEIVSNASKKYFAKDFLTCGEGGSIPFIGFLNEKFPSALFLVTGTLGPESNAHAGNEALDIEYTKKFLCALSKIVGDSFGFFANRKK